MAPFSSLPNEPEYATILERARLLDARVVAMYRYGSRVYGTQRPDSDYDYVVVYRQPEERKQFSDNRLDLTLLSPEAFESRLHQHEVMPLECIFLPAEHRLKEMPAQRFALDKKLLYECFLEKAEKSLEMARKKVAQASDHPVGLSALFHAFRILSFGTQIAEAGRIVDYRAANDLRVLIGEDVGEEWEYFRQEFDVCKEAFYRLTHP
jgi:predicted nucleotidyltransferase